jgi:TPR repeat protein
VAEDDAEAVRWFTLSAEQGNLYAAHRLGVHYSRGDGVAEDDVEGVRWFRLAAEGGVAEAQLSMAVHYYGGEGVPGSLEEAFAWAAISAGQGNYQAARFQTRLEEDLTDEMLRRAAELAQTYWKQFVVPFLNQAN